jgi:transposase-like protein
MASREGEIMLSFKGAHFEKEMSLTCGRWYVAYPLSYRQLEEMMQERGVSVDHSTINRWVLKYSLQREAACHRRKRPVWVSWRMDKTYIIVRRPGYPRWCRAHAHAQEGTNGGRGGEEGFTPAAQFNPLVA